MENRIISPSLSIGTILDLTPTGHLGARAYAKRRRRVATGLCTLEVEGAQVRRVLEHGRDKAK